LCFATGWIIAVAYHGFLGIITGLIVGGIIWGVAMLPLLGIAALITASRPKHPRLKDDERYRRAL
jgi:hypothetical protein